MSKKKPEKEGKEKKQTGKKAAVKAVSATVPAGGDSSVELAGAKLKAKKPKAATPKKAAKAAAISAEDIAMRAYFIAERRHKMGWHGDSTSDWVEAERQLKAEAARKK